MKLYRSDLENSISNQLFEISTEEFELDSIIFVEKTIFCKISAEPTNGGFHIYGDIAVELLESCDRCLLSYKSQKNIELNIILTNNDDLLNEKNIDIIQFLDSEDFVSLNPLIRDLILLENPIKKLCSKECKGLCANCGTNFNKLDCECEISIEDNRWIELKKLNN